MNRIRSIVICTAVRLGRRFSHIRTNRRRGESHCALNLRADKPLDFKCAVVIHPATASRVCSVILNCMYFCKRPFAEFVERNRIRCKESLQDFYQRREQDCSRSAAFNNPTVRERP